MKYILSLALMPFIATSAFAYQDSAVGAALESHFDAVVAYWGIEYSESSIKECDLIASALARKVSSQTSAAYECQVCLIADDNLLWDYGNVSCELSWD